MASSTKLGDFNCTKVNRRFTDDIHGYGPQIIDIQIILSMSTFPLVAQAEGMKGEYFYARNRN